jgi:hypothetical protein
LALYSCAEPVLLAGIREGIMARTFLISVLAIGSLICCSATPAADGNNAERSRAAQDTSSTTNVQNKNKDKKTGLLVPAIQKPRSRSSSSGKQKTAKESGEKGGTTDISIGVGEDPKAPRANDRLRTAGPVDGSKTADAAREKSRAASKGKAESARKIEERKK